MATTEPFLRELPLFSRLSPSECAELERRMKQREFPPQTVIVREGGPGNAAFFIVAGLVAVRRKEPESGIEFQLAELGPGQMFGEMALLTGKPRNATVAAVQPTSCAVLEKADFERVIAEHPTIALGVTAMLAERLERADRLRGAEFVRLSRLHVDPRVLSLIPHALISEHHVLPIAFCNNRLTLAMANPDNIVAFDDVRRVIKGVLIEPVVMTDDDFKKFMTTTYPQLIAKPEQVVRSQPQYR